MMNFEQDIFKRRVFDFVKLLEYGFKKLDHEYLFSTLMMDSFKVEIRVSQEGMVKGKIYDLVLDDEYVNFRVENNVGEFVNRVRNEYQKILEDIALHCTISNDFIFVQSNRVAKWVFDLYGDKPEFAWEKSPGFGIFRNPINEKWYGLIMNIDKSKLDSDEDGEVEILNLKLNPLKIPELLKKDGFYSCYHMNKKNWVTITLDDTLSDEEIMEYVRESHQFTEVSRDWIVPANPKVFDIISYFENEETILWHQSAKMEIGDNVFIYMGSPYSAILYQCIILETDVSCDDEAFMNSKTMKLKLVKSFDKEAYPFSKLKEYGVNAIRGARRMPASLREEIRTKEC